MHEDIEKSRIEKEKLAAALVIECETFIQRHPGIFNPPLDLDRLDAMDEHDQIFKEAIDLRAKLNQVVNELNIIGGEANKLIYKISELIRHLDIIVHNRCYYMQNRILYYGDLPYTHRISKKIKLEVESVFAMETRYGEATINPNSSELQVNGNIGVEEIRLKKIYHSIQVLFSLCGKTKPEERHFGWVMLNLMMRELIDGMGHGHALGRIWDGNEIDVKIREMASQKNPDNLDTNSITLISCVNQTPHFTNDQLRLNGDPDAIRDRLRFLIGDICEWTQESIKPHNKNQIQPVRGGRRGLVPLLQLAI